MKDGSFRLNCTNTITSHYIYLNPSSLGEGKVSAFILVNPSLSNVARVLMCLAQYLQGVYWQEFGSEIDPVEKEALMSGSIQMK